VVFLSGQTQFSWFLLWLTKEHDNVPSSHTTFDT